VLLCFQIVVNRVFLGTFDMSSGSVRRVSRQDIQLVSSNFTMCSVFWGWNEVCINNLLSRASLFSDYKRLVTYFSYKQGINCRHGCLFVVLILWKIVNNCFCRHSKHVNFAATLQLWTIFLKPVWICHKICVHVRCSLLL